MFIKTGDANPISIIEPADVSDEATKKQLQKVLDETKASKNSETTKKEINE